MKGRASRASWRHVLRLDYPKEKSPYPGGIGWDPTMIQTKLWRPTEVEEWTCSHFRCAAGKRHA